MAPPRGIQKLLMGPKKFWDIHSTIFQQRYGHQMMDLLDLPVKIILSPFTLAIDAVGSAPRGFGIPKLVSDVAFSAIFFVGTLGAYDIAVEMGKKVLCQRNCRTCNGWQALRCTMCKGTGTVHYQVKNYRQRRGEKATAECVAEAISDNRAELVHLPSAIDIPFPLPSKECPSCDGSGVMRCPECKDHRLQVRISADDIMEPPWKAYNVLRKMDYPYENIVNSMKDPKIAAFWLLTMPQMMGGFEFDDEVKQKIWWAYKESTRYDQLRDLVAKKKPGWELLQEVLISLDPVRAKGDPAIVRNVPFYKAKKALEAEVMKLDALSRPDNWGSQDLDLPIKVSLWTEEELRDPKKLLEATALLTAQKEMADKLLDAQWESKWRQEKLNELLKEKMQPYIQSIETGELSQPIIIESQEQENKKKTGRKRWWFF